MTNILASVVVMIVTNVYSPKQYLQISQYMTYPPRTVERWVDEPFGGIGFGGGGEVVTRDNPDIQYVEVREIRKIMFHEHGIPDFVISDTLKSKVKRTRVVEERWDTSPEEIVQPQRWGLATNTIRIGGWVYTNTVITNIVELAETNKVDTVEAR